MYRGIHFLQSSNDFPLQVTLGKQSPVWGLSRWNNERLRFLPPDDEGFTLRGDKRRLVYKGRRRSHRFTILGDTSFEYDCILNREPESNTISLVMDGAENFDFFQQPDFVKDPFLKGSYAVYKKETLTGEGTGKLCHIHRPEILDSRGRRCWGDVSVTGNELRITIPENFLSEAKYPVTVDPVIGCSTAGACHFFYYIYDSEYEECLEDWRNNGDSDAEIAEYLEEWKTMPSAYQELLFNRWTIPEPLQGLCKVYFHVAEIDYGSYNVFAPVLFNESLNIPDTRISSEEYGWLGTRGSSPPGWNMTTFQVQNTVAENSPLWLGLIASGIGISFDYGVGYFDIMGNINPVTAKTNITNGQHLGELLNRVGAYIPDYREAVEYGDEEWIEELRPSVGYQNRNAHPKRPGRYDFRFSYYFQPASTAYTRTLTAGVTLGGGLKPAGGYTRTAAQTVTGITALGRFEGYRRSLVQTAKSSVSLKRSSSLIRKLIQQTGVSDTGKRFLSILRKLTQQAGASDTGKRFLSILRKLTQQAGANDTGRRFLSIMWKLIQQVGTSDTDKRFLSMLRKPAQTAGAASGTQRITQAERSIADTGRPGTVIGRKQDFKRGIAHTGNAGTAVLKRADYVRRFEERAGSASSTGVVRDMVLRLVEAAAALYEMKAGAGFNRSVTDTVKNSSGMGGVMLFFRILSNRAGSGDRAGSFMVYMRAIQDTETLGDDTGYTADYLRGLFVEAGTIAETKHRAEYRRKQQDTAYSEAVPLRHLFIFLRLVTLSLVRDYIIGRFLKSKEEIIIKSPVCREITLESPLH